MSIEARQIQKTIDLNNTGSRIHMPQVKPAEMTNLEYQDGGQSAFSMDK